MPWCAPWAVHCVGAASTSSGCVASNGRSQGAGTADETPAATTDATAALRHAPLLRRFTQFLQVGDARTASDTRAFLLSLILDKFPGLKRADLYLAGESYAGHCTCPAPARRSRPSLRVLGAQEGRRRAHRRFLTSRNPLD